MKISRLLPVVLGLLLAHGQVAAQTDSTGVSRLNGLRSLDPGSSSNPAPTGSGTPWTKWFLGQERWWGGSFRAVIGADGYMQIHNYTVGRIWQGGYTSGTVPYTPTLEIEVNYGCWQKLYVGATGWDVNGAPTGWTINGDGPSWCPQPPANDT